MFQAVKGIKKEDLVILCEELSEDLPSKLTISALKEVILKSESYKEDPAFVQDILSTTVADRQAKELEKERKHQEEKERAEKENQRQHELELARINAGVVSDRAEESTEVGHVRKKFHLPKLELRQFSGYLKDWLPFWSQFEHVHNDLDIAPENKFQYLVQATVSGSRAREVVESFPPTGANYSKAVESLKSRFGRSDLLIEFYVRELLKLVIENAQQNSTTNLCALYDNLESQIRALETLGVTTDKSAALLHPLVESCLPEEILRAWQRQRSPDYENNREPHDRLANLLKFLKAEVESEERICLAMQGFGLNKRKDGILPKSKKYDFKENKGKTPTASSLFSNTHVRETKKSCVFCGKSHASSECFSAQKMSLEEKRKILREKKCCFACLIPGHDFRKCRSFVKCLICSKRHYALICDQLPNLAKPSQPNDNTPENDVNMSNFSKSPKVLLQTLQAKLISDSNEMMVRVLYDSGSQRSYILKDVAEKMKYTPIREEKLIHSLFGGVSSGEYKHTCYKIKLRNLNGSFGCNFEVFDQAKICEDVQPVGKGSWIKELKHLGIELSDVEDCSKSIQVLIGADIMGKLLTGRRKELKSGLVALETKLGWTVMGKIASEQSKENNLAMIVTSLFVKEADISELWKLDLIGIKDPIEKKSRVQQDYETMQHFKETVNFKEGRYEISLPWSDDKAPLPDNFSLAKHRLENTTIKLVSSGLYQNYEKVFQEWLSEGIIEVVEESEEKLYGHYLPHHPVVKVNSTTPIRPVFDASARMKNQPSLNQCLENGPNLIELIPDILLRFRERKFGVTADIRKAFLQISVIKKDRDVLRFLWWKNEERKELKFFRHTRVVFGVKCSPFLLSAVIEHHINNCEALSVDFKNKLKRSFYVDNVVTSVDHQDELKDFISSATEVMSKGGFELRGWEYSKMNQQECEEPETPLLGLKWHRQKDILRVDMGWLSEINVEKLTKRIILSIVHRVYDPIGFTSPVMIVPKLILQELWKQGVAWDEVIADDKLKQQFLQWFHELKLLEKIHVPRWTGIDFKNIEDCTLHCFCDASKDAYATVIFIRIGNGEYVELRLIAAKSRVAPLKGGGGTIPRKELLAALIGARLTNSVVEAVGWKAMRCFYWSDSTTAIAWISREENWSIFVRNRVQEIRKLSNPSSWYHVPGGMNPSDLPSRGCNVKQLISLAWWEGPQWLKEPLQNILNVSTPEFKEEEIVLEKMKTVKILADVEKTTSTDWYYKYFSKYPSIVRMIGWILRFKNNCSKPQSAIKGELTVKEFEEAEKRIIWMIQKESFKGVKDDRLKSLGTFKDERDILRLKTKLIYRKDHENFIKPVILPSKHQVVYMLIQYIHEKNCHAGVQITLNQLRERFWILSGRKTVHAVLSKCVICKRFNSKNLEAAASPLPENRVNDAYVFQIVGIDMAGPLFLRDQKKCWVLIFTCAVYRAVHLELILSASTDAFLMAFRRFVARRGRCSVVYCDNGTNFVGAANSLKRLDWKRIEKYGALNSIQWKFNPPAAAWWGGWWERLIRLLKDLLKRVIGMACLSYEELGTVLADCESVLNSRPLTYIYEKECLKPISPSLFLQDIHECSLPDVDTVDQKSLIKRIRYRQALQKELRKRFRLEYLGHLVQRKNSKQTQWNIAVGDIVLVGSDNKKRVNWPLGRIIEILPGKDGCIRLVRIQTATNQLLRPVQRVYPLEISYSNNSHHSFVRDYPRGITGQNLYENLLEHNSGQVTDKLVTLKKTKSGRVVRIPERLNL